MKALWLKIEKFKDKDTFFDVEQSSDDEDFSLSDLDDKHVLRVVTNALRTEVQKVNAPRSDELAKAFHTMTHM
jgi:hypothetical protein